MAKEDKMRRWFVVLMGLLFCVSALNAQRVYLMPSNNAAADEDIHARLVACGFTVVDGVPHYSFDGSQSLAGIDAVLLPPYNNYSRDMPNEGQIFLRNWIQNGGGLVTLEWTIWMYGIGYLQTLGEAFPSQPTTPWRCATNITYTIATADPVLNANLPDSFSVPLYKGETQIVPKPGATIFYHTDFSGGEGVIGWNYGSGRVLNISFDDGYCSAGEHAVSNTHFGQLVCNAIHWVQGTSSQPGDVNGDGCVDDADLLLVLFNFGGSGEGDLNHDGVVDDADLLEVLFNFGNGC
jgi:hypothetical protein